MAVTTDFLNTCRTAISSLSELTAFRSALAGALTGTRTARVAAWHATYRIGNDGTSPHLNLGKAIRGVVGAQADASGALGELDRESACRTLLAEFAPKYDRPPTDKDEMAALDLLIRQEQVS